MDIKSKHTNYYQFVLFIRVCIIIIIGQIVLSFFISTAVTSHALLELMEASVSQLVNAKMEDLVILCLENATAQKDGL